MKEAKMGETMRRREEGRWEEGGRQSKEAVFNSIS